MNSIRTSLLMTSGICLIAAAAPALAAQPLPDEQQAQAVDAPQIAPSTRPKDVVAGEDIIVTAQKRAQTLIDVPQSITVVSGATLEKQQANSFQDYLKLVPGLQLEQSTPGESRLILRGLNTGGVASTVSVYLDEVPFGSSNALVNGATLAGDFDTFDINRVEVLRGPQGTIYGASSLGGVVKFVTNLPSTSETILRGRIGIDTVTGGDMGTIANLAVNIPLSNTIAVRASGAYRKDGGFIDSIGSGGSDIKKNINGDHIYSGRVSLLFKPSDRASVRLSAIAQNINADAPTIVEADPLTLKPLYGKLTQSQFVPQFTNVKYRVYSGTGTLGLGFADLTSVTGYSTENQHLRSDLTNALSPLIQAIFGVPNEFIEPQHTNLKKFTQELRLASHSAALDWLVGGYYTDEKGLILQDLTALEPGTTTPITGLPLLAHVTLDSRYRELAGFANATAHLGEHLDIDFGGRYSHNKQSAHEISNGALAGGAIDFPVARSHENVFTYSVAPKYKINRNASLYARVAKGFRPGGPNVLPPGPIPADVPMSYRSDSVINYEAGFKAEAPDRRFSFDASVYHINWKDIQLLAVVNGFGVNANGPSARSNGAEATATVRPIPGLDLSANAAFTDAKLTKDAPPIVGGRKGDRLPYTPKFSAALNADYHWLVGPTATAHVGGSARHLSQQTAAYDPVFVATYGRQRKIGAYEVFDFDTGVDFGRFSLDAYVKNIGNRHGITSTTATTVFGAFPIYPGGAIGTGVIRPRTFGLALTAQY